MDLQMKNYNAKLLCMTTFDLTMTTHTTHT